MVPFADAGCDGASPSSRLPFVAGGHPTFDLTPGEDAVVLTTVLPLTRPF